MPWVGCGRLPWWWWCLHFLKQQSLLLQFLLHRLTAELFLSQLVVLFLSLGFGQHGLLSLRPCYHLWLRRPYLQGLLLGPSHFLEVSINSSHCCDVFGAMPRSSRSTSCCPSAMVSTEMLSLLALVPCATVASSCVVVVVVVVVVVSAEATLVSPFFFAAMWCGVSNRWVGAKLLVESVFGMDEHYNSTGNARKSRRESSLSLSLFNVSHQCTLQGYL